MSELKNKNIWIHITFFSILGCGLGDRQFSENSDFRGMTDIVFIELFGHILKLILIYSIKFEINLSWILLPQELRGQF